jgi:hypothetical protein
MAKKERPLSLREQLVRDRASRPDPSPPDDSEFEEKFPLLWQLLTGLVRNRDKPGGLELCDQPLLLLRMGDGCWSASISDPATAQSFALELSCLGQLWEQLEAALGAGAKWTRARRRKPQVRGISKSGD